MSGACWGGSRQSGVSQLVPVLHSSDLFKRHRRWPGGLANRASTGQGRDSTRQAPLVAAKITAFDPRTGLMSQVHDGPPLYEKPRRQRPFSSHRSIILSFASE